MIINLYFKNKVKEDILEKASRVLFHTYTLNQAKIDDRYKTFYNDYFDIKQIKSILKDKNLILLNIRNEDKQLSYIFQQIIRNEAKITFYDE
jgi:hypothetical protein